MTNCGKFDLHVDWELKSQPPPVTPPVPAGKAAKPKSASAAAKDAAALTAAAPVFLFEPRVSLSALVLYTHAACYHLSLPVAGRTEAHVQPRLRSGGLSGTSTSLFGCFDNGTRQLYQYYACNPAKTVD